MMRLDAADTIDYLGIEKGTGTIVLTLADDCDWADETHHLSLLQKKINRYFDFIESGEIFTQLLDTTGRDVSKSTAVKISVLTKFEPTLEGSRFFEYVAEVARGAGVQFSLKAMCP